MRSAWLFMDGVKEAMGAKRRRTRTGAEESSWNLVATRSLRNRHSHVIERHTCASRPAAGGGGLYLWTVTVRASSMSSCWFARRQMEVVRAGVVSLGPGGRISRFGCSRRARMCAGVTDACRRGNMKPENLDWAGEYIAVPSGLRLINGRRNGRQSRYTRSS